ncbi:assimilatory nitrate reductase catalytic subunit [Marinospirillum celere]|uniref:Assimilatory nitrate reductase catalytic subunit n=1 Tax=Marinospirillum celere TaxID=1122252 RepID=A0A1I1G4U5_9GAMM|nr:nitrate reductase [Marinospirillum celere]SFC06342.1 assimilatory nitrate reductase catalytic subunit [Marinospirillum celere]
MNKQAKRKVSTTCPYCGVGCGVQASIQGNDLIATTGDQRHSANLGRLCIKGSKLPETGGHAGRLLYPQVAGQRVSWDQAVKSAAEGLQGIIDRHGPESVAFYLSGQLLTEDYYVANKLMKGFIGSSHVDTNSRLCMASTVAGHKRAFGADAVPGCYEDLELADLLVLVGSNAAWNHPVLYQRIQAAKQERPELKVVVIDPRRTATCDLADLHLALKPGTDSLLFNALLVHLAENQYLDHEFICNSTDHFTDSLLTALAEAADLKTVASQLDVPEHQLMTFFNWFAETPKTVTLFSQGVNQSSSGTDKVNALINCHLATGRVGKPGSTPFSLTGQPNAMGGREVGGLANQLAAHMGFSSEEVTLVEEFWQAPRMARQEGYKALDLFKAIHRGDIKAIWIQGTNPLVSLPDSQFVREALEKCELVIVSEAMAETDTMEFADIALPATTWSEKNGTVTNSERRISRQRGFLPAPGEARHDWQILCQVAKALGHGEAFNYQSPAAIFREHAALSGFKNQGQRCFDISGLQHLTDQAYESLQPVQWPVNSSNPLGTERLFTQGKFFTASQRAQFLSIQSRPPEQKLDPAYPFRLNTGRIRDQWHSMTRTGRSAALMQHRSEPFIEVHPEDAAQVGLQDQGLARVSHPQGEYLGRVRFSEGQRPGEIFLPMHWNRQFTGKGLCNQLIEQICDPVSGQPESKQGRVQLEALKTSWQAQLLVAQPLKKPLPATYLAEQPLTNSHSYVFAGSQAVEDWSGWCEETLGQRPQMHLQTSQEGPFRAAGFDQGQLAWVLAVSRERPQLAIKEIDQQFASSSLSPEARQALFTPSEHQAEDQLICSCFQVSANQIKQAISEGQDTPELLGQSLSCGTNCGSCLPEIKSLIEQEVPHGITELV